MFGTVEPPPTAVRRETTMIQNLQRSMLFPREHAVPPPNPGAGIDDLERVWLDTPQGQVESWFLRGKDVTDDNPGPAVIFAHGNAELIDYWPAAMQAYRDLGISVWLGEYRGYGRSDGTPSQAHITEDFVAFYDYLYDRDEVDGGRILMHGRSLGGAVIAQLAALRTPRALILESTFTSVVDFAAQFFIPRAFVADPFDTEAILRSLDAPLLLFHGKRDSVVPFSHAERLRDAAKNVKLVTYDSDHNDFPPDPVPYWDEIEAFVSSVLSDS